MWQDNNKKNKLSQIVLFVSLCFPKKKKQKISYHQDENWCVLLHVQHHLNITMLIFSNVHFICFLFQSMVKSFASDSNFLNDFCVGIFFFFSVSMSVCGYWNYFNIDYLCSSIWCVALFCTKRHFNDLQSKPNSNRRFKINDLNEV